MMVWSPDNETHKPLMTTSVCLDNSSSSTICRRVRLGQAVGGHVGFKKQHTLSSYQDLGFVASRSAASMPCL